MTFDPFLSAPVHIQIHAVAAMIAVAIGPLAILRQRRDRAHKVAGYLWVTAMLVTALSAFSIGSFGVIGPFSPIHLLAVVVLWSLWRAMAAIFRGDVALHRKVMASLYWRGLILAGLFNFLPGRIASRAVFGDRPEAGYVVIALGLAVIFRPEITTLLRHVVGGVTRLRAPGAGLSGCET